jgi:hypothetical protein
MMDKHYLQNTSMYDTSYTEMLNKHLNNNANLWNLAGIRRNLRGTINVQIEVTSVASHFLVQLTFFVHSLSLSLSQILFLHRTPERGTSVST